MNEDQIILQTDRLILRHETERDIEPLVALWSDPEVTRYLGGPRDQLALRESFEQLVQSPFPDDYDLWPVVERSSGKVVGHAGLLEKEVEGKAEIELVFVISSSHWGKGYASEIAEALKDYAFDELGLDMLIALIEPENAASERVAVKIGMSYKNTIARPNGQTRKLYVLMSPEV